MAYLAAHDIERRLEAALQQVVLDQPADPISAIAALLSVPNDGTALAAADASTTLAITVHHGERGEAALLDAARMLGGSQLASQCGLAAALEKLSVCSPPPADVTSWLVSRLRELRPVVVVADYPEPVLKDLLMKCDEFANIHLLKTERPHPEVRLEEPWPLQPVCLWRCAYRYRCPSAHALAVSARASPHRFGTSVRRRRQVWPSLGVASATSTA